MSLESKPSTRPGHAERLLRGIYQETRGSMNRGVRDVAELETGLTPEEARAAWRHLLSEGLIRRFNLAYAAILSPEGISAIESGVPVADPPPPPATKVFIVRGSGTAACEAVARFAGDSELEA